MENLDVKKLVDECKVVLKDEDSATVQAILLNVAEESVDPNFNIRNPGKDTKVRLHDIEDDGVIVVHVNNLAGISLRRLYKLYNSYSRIVGCTVSTATKGNTPLSVTMVINKASGGEKNKDQHAPKANNEISNVMDGLRWTSRDLTNIKTVQKDVIDMDLGMYSPKWEIIDRADSYVLVATPIHSVNLAFYEYITRKHPGLINNIVYRTDSANPNAAAAPRFEIYCNCTRKTSLTNGADPGDASDHEDAAVSRPAKKARRNDYFQG